MDVFVPLTDTGELDRLLSGYSVFQLAYYNDPASFARHCIDWKESGLTKYQGEIMDALVKHKRISVRSPHGAGKTATAAILVLWFVLTRDGRVDWKIGMTASVWRQLTNFLLPEIRKWAHRLKWDKIGRPMFSKDEMLLQSLKMKTGEAIALASDNPYHIEGLHGDEVFYLLDEAKSIPPETWDAAEGGFSVGKCLVLSISTPGEPVGRFYDIQSRRAGYEDWHVRAITIEEMIEAGRVNIDWVADRKSQWGEQSAVYQNRVLGQFASSEEDGVIPLSWIEAANARWEIWNDGDKSGQPFKCVGVDVARSGEDKTVLALRSGDVITELRSYSKRDTMETTGMVQGILEAYGGYSVVDVIGVGAGVVDRLRELKKEVKAFNASEHTDVRDVTRELGFSNCRSASWWLMRELLDPSQNHQIALPPDDMLTGDLTAAHWKVMSGGKVLVESKEDIKERIGRSTDFADAVIMAFWEDREPSMQQWISAYSKRMQKEV